VADVLHIILQRDRGTLKNTLERKWKQGGIGSKERKGELSDNHKYTNLKVKFFAAHGCNLTRPSKYSSISMFMPCTQTPFFVLRLPG